MSHIGKNYGIVTERDNHSVSIFDIDTLHLLHRIPLDDTDPVDVVITPDGSKAVVTSFNSKLFFQLDLAADPPTFITSNQVSTPLEDVDISPDGRFAVSVDGSTSGTDTNLYSYELQTNSVISQIPAGAQAVSIPFNWNGLILTAKNNLNQLISFFMNTNTGTLTGPTSTIDSHGNRPINITFTHDGNYAFIVNDGITDPTGRNVAIFNTQDKNNITWLGSVNISDTPQSITVSRDDKKVYVLTTSTVDIFNFDPATSPYLTPANPVSSFSHGLNISIYLGVDQIALDRTETKLLISGLGSVKVFDAQTGQDLGTVQDVTPDGGIAAAPAIVRGLKFF